MVYYISSPVYQQTISSALKEKDCIIGDGFVDSHFLLAKYIKENIAKFSISMDVLVIDISALDDSDDEVLKAIKSIRTLYDEVRIIIMAPTRLPGDKLLSELFGLGILNIIATPDYLKLKEELFLCLGDKGKSFKDALVFKEVKQNVEVVGKERLKVVSRVLVGVTSSQSRMGVTHNILTFAVYLRKLGFLVAVVEKNNSGSLEQIRIGHNEKLHTESYFTMYGVDFYPAVLDKTKMKIILDKTYNFILCDYGSIQQCDKADFLNCHEKVLIVGSKTWELPYLNRILKEYPDNVLQQFHICFNLVYEKHKKYLKQAMKYADDKPMPVFFLDYNPEPFNAESFTVAEEILEDYMLRPKQKEKEGLFSRLFKGGKA